MCRFFFVAPAALSQMKDINQENHGESIVRHHGNEIVDGCDERAGSHSRINVNFMENMGITVPTRLEIIIATMSEMPTQPDSRKACPQSYG